jgi:uncharacterized protein
MQRLIAVVAGLVLFFFAAQSWAKYVPPSIVGYVTDTAGVLSPQEIQVLDQKLANYRRCSTNHVAVFIPATLEGYSIEDVGYQTGNTWKVGEAGKDNGVILILAPSERRIRIETGKGAGGDLPDIETARILRDVVAPNMKEEKFFAAADQATTRIGRALGGCGISDIGASPTPDFHPKTGFRIPFFVVENWPYFIPAALLFFLGVRAGISRGTLGVGLIWAVILSGGVIVAGVLAGWTGASGICTIAVFILLILWANKPGEWNKPPPAGYSNYSSGSSDSSSSSSSDSSSSSSSSDYSGGGGSFGGGGSSDSY